MLCLDPSGSSWRKVMCPWMQHTTSPPAGCISQLVHRSSKRESATSRPSAPSAPCRSPSAPHLLLVLSFECDHHPVANARRVAVERSGEPDTSAAAGLSPGDELLVVHHPPDAEFTAQGIVEFGRLLAVVRAERHIADHLRFS